MSLWTEMSDDELARHARKVVELGVETSRYGREVAAEAKRRFDERYAEEKLPPLKVTIVDYGRKAE